MNLVKVDRIKWSLSNLNPNETKRLLPNLNLEVADMIKQSLLSLNLEKANRIKRLLLNLNSNETKWLLPNLNLEEANRIKQSLLNLNLDEIKRSLPSLNVEEGIGVNCHY